LEATSFERSLLLTLSVARIDRISFRLHAPVLLLQ
jgi:hypothetical protein